MKYFVWFFTFTFFLFPSSTGFQCSNVENQPFELYWYVIYSGSFIHGCGNVAWPNRMRFSPDANETKSNATAPMLSLIIIRSVFGIGRVT